MERAHASPLRDLLHRDLGVEVLVHPPDHLLDSILRFHAPPPDASNPQKERCSPSNSASPESFDSAGSLLAGCCYSRTVVTGQWPSAGGWMWQPLSSTAYCWASFSCGPRPPRAGRKTIPAAKLDVMPGRKVSGTRSLSVSTWTKPARRIPRFGATWSAHEMP